MVSNLSQKLFSLLKSSLLARLLLMLLPLLLAPKPELDSEDSQLDSILVQSFYPTTVLLPSDLTEEEDLEEVSELVLEEDSEEEDSYSEETHTHGHRLVTITNSPLLTHLMTHTSTL